MAEKTRAEVAAEIQATIESHWDNWKPQTAEQRREDFRRYGSDLMAERCPESVGHVAFLVDPPDASGNMTVRLEPVTPEGEAMLESVLFAMHMRVPAAVWVDVRLVSE